ncbi:MAG: dihydroorotate dehydrogenase electron transfer subunit, partial [Steroidobacteraceae bacterium]
MSGRSHRGTIFVEETRLIGRESFDGEQYILRLEAPRCAQAATPGSFVHISCDAALPMRRPLSIMRADAAAGWIDLLFKIVGPGLRQLSQQPLGAGLSVIGPIGQGFTPHRERPRTLLVGGGVGIPPMIFLAEVLKKRADAAFKPLVLMGS